MKTKRLICAIVVYALLWMLMSAVVYVLNVDMSYRACFSQPLVVFIVCFLGWIPALIVDMDISPESYKETK